jgi:acetyl-CoA C-acetyltransferase
MLWDTLVDQYCGLPLAITAENLAERYSVSRQEQDEFALRSHILAVRAGDSGRLLKEIVPLEVRGAKGGPVQTDEIPRRDTSLEALGKLSPRFKEGGTVTAGNASGISDGAAALVVTTDRVARELGLRPMARLVSWAAVGVDPAIMGIGPAPAIRQALSRASLKLEDMDLVEVNEAFAAQTVAVLKELNLSWDKVNVNGGAIALGHPLGASGARLALTLAYELRERGMRYGVVALCIGGGQGIAAVLENLQR